MYSKGIPIAQGALLHHDYAELNAEPGGGTTPLQCHSAPNHTPEEITGDLPTHDVPPIGDGVLFDIVIPLVAEGGSQIPPPKVRTNLA